MTVLNWMKVGEVGQDEMHVKAMIYGNSGAGKTHTAATAPNPVYLLTEPNGLPTIRTANPNAVVIQADEGNGGMETVRAFLRAAKDGTLARETGAKTVVLDSMNELQRMVRDEILAKKRTAHGEGVFTLQDWGVLTDKMRAMIRAFRDLPFHLVGITHADTQQEDGGSRHILPMFMGRSLPNEIAGYFSIVGYQYRTSEKGEDGQILVKRQVMFEGPPTVVCKGLRGLSPIEEPNITTWITKIHGNTR